MKGLLDKTRGSKKASSKMRENIRYLLYFILAASWSGPLYYLASLHVSWAKAASEENAVMEDIQILILIIAAVLCLAVSNKRKMFQNVSHWRLTFIGLIFMAGTEASFGKEYLGVKAFTFREFWGFSPGLKLAVAGAVLGLGLTLSIIVLRNRLFLFGLLKDGIRSRYAVFLALSAALLLTGHGVEKGYIPFRIKMGGYFTEEFVELMAYQILLYMPIEALLAENTPEAARKGPPLTRLAASRTRRTCRP